MLDSILTEEGQYPKQSLPTKSSSSSIDKSQQGQSQYSYSKKSLLNILLVILTSIQITLIFHSRVYINKDLVRSFLSFYVDISQQPEIFNGQSFTIQLQNISELQANIKFALQKLSDPQNRSLLNIDFSSSPLKLRISYHPQIIQYYNISQFTIDPTIGIVQPFQLDNLTDIQMFLLKVNHFELFIDNIHITTEELSEKYSHRVIYSYQQRSQIKINYYFDVFKIISINLDQDIPETFQLFNLKIFYFVIILFACINLYFEIAYIKMTIIQFYHNYNGNQSSKISKRLKWSDIINIFQVELIFSILANIMQIISNIYLFVGRKHEYIIGIGCLFGWMTIFGTLKHYKKFILMYELIKLSIRKVLEFLLSFMVIFMGYCFLGMCLFPKVKYFSSLSYSVTTLVAIMAGDSIDLFTTSLTLKYSTILSIAYIFIYVLLFMHAIHNTLTSIIKQFFIIQKIGLVKIQKLKKGHQNYIYLSEKPIQNQQIKKNLPIKLTQTFQKQIYKIKKQSKLKDCNKRMREIILNLQNMLINEKWQILDAQFQTNQAFKLELESRIMKITHLIHKIQKKQSQNLHQI